MQDDAVELVMLAAGEAPCIEREMDAALGQLAESLEAGLKCCDVILEGKVVVRSERRGVHAGNEDGLGLCSGVGNGSERTLLEAGPEAALEQQFHHAVPVERGNLRYVELDGIILSIGFHPDFKELAFVTADNGVDGAADWRAECHLRILLVGEEWRAGLDAVPFLHEQARNHATEIRGFDSYQTGRDFLRHFAKSRSRYGKVQALFQSDLI